MNTKKSLSALLAGLSCLLCLICLVRISALERHIDRLGDDIGNSSDMLRSQVDALSGSIRESLEEQASLLSDSGYGFGTADMESMTVPVTIFASPKEYLPGITAATLNVDGREYPMEQNGNAFSATVNLMLVEEVTVESVSFRELSTVRTEALGWLLSPRSQYLPEVAAQFAGDNTHTGSRGGVHTCRMYGTVIIDSWGPSAPEIHSLSLAEALDGEITSRTPLDVPEPASSAVTEHFNSVEILLDREFSFPDGSAHTLYLEAEDQYGFTHRCTLSHWVSDGEDSCIQDREYHVWQGAAGNLYTGNGKLVYRNYPEP